MLEKDKPGWGDLSQQEIEVIEIIVKGGKK